MSLFKYHRHTSLIIEQALLEQEIRDDISEYLGFYPDTQKQYVDSLDSAVDVSYEFDRAPSIEEESVLYKEQLDKKVAECLPRIIAEEKTLRIARSVDYKAYLELSKVIK